MDKVQLFIILSIILSIIGAFYQNELSGLLIEDQNVLLERNGYITNRLKCEFKDDESCIEAYTSKISRSWTDHLAIRKQTESKSKWYDILSISNLIVLFMALVFVVGKNEETKKGGKSPKETLKKWHWVFDGLANLYIGMVGGFAVVYFLGNLPDWTLSVWVIFVLAGFAAFFLKYESN